MYRFALYKPGWWLLHFAAVSFFFWLGHAMGF